MTIWKTGSLALVAAALLAGCATTNYYGDASGNYASDNSGYAAPYDNNQYGNQYDQYSNNQGDYDPADVSFGTFERELSPYGDWSYHPRWGDVWRPRVAFGFKPYFNGYWASTREYGWMWISDDPWGDLTYRYGRWVFDPRDGWMWVPGYVWGPSWVVWRSGGGSIGWFPMPPDDYNGNGPYRGNYASFYGYRDWYGPGFSNDTFFSLWIFVGEDRFADRNYRNYVMPARDYGRVIVQTNEVTNYVTVNNVIINQSINIQNIERASNRRVETVEARTVMRGRAAVVRPVSAGRQVEQRERRERPIPANVRQDDIRDARENARDVREDVRDRREDVRDRREDVRDARENLRDRRDPPGNGPQNVRGPNNQNQAERLERQEERFDNRGRFGGPQDRQAPQNVNVPRNDNQADRPDRREERLENRGRGPQNVNVPPQNGNVERAVERPARERPDNNARQDNNSGQNALVGRGVERAAPAPSAPSQPSAQPANRASAPVVQTGGGNNNSKGNASSREQRQEERDARREDAAERRNR
jgi:hypothetical protein